MTHKFELPISVRVRARNYAIRPLSKNAARKGRMVGDCNFDNKIIRVSVDQSWEDVVSTLLHEISHAMLSEYEIEIPNEERAVLKLEEAWFQMLMDNKAVFQSILDGMP